MSGGGHSSVGGEAQAVRIRLLGGFSVSVGTRTVRQDAWRRGKAAKLVKLLALASGHRLHREQLMDALWPDLRRSAASNNLRQAHHAARRVLGLDPASSPYLVSEDEALALCSEGSEGSLWVDVEAFEEAARTAHRSRDPAAYRAAIDLYAGELLPTDRYEEWAEEHRWRLREMHLSLLIGLARLQEERADYDGAAEALREVLAEDPVREEAHAGLMRLHALLGRQGEALRQYERLEEVLSRELSAEPGAASRTLREEIAARRFPPPKGQPPVVASQPEEQRVEDTGQHNLPAQRTGFVGKEREMLEVKRQLAMTRLLTLTGAGGSGKTRLALEVARDLQGAYPDGVWLVELAPLSEGKLVPQAVADALGVPEEPGRSLADTLVDALREKKLLVVLDNCEHLIEAAAQLADALLSSCPRLRVLATSREALGVEGELVWRVDPLSVPDSHRDADRDAHRAPAAGELARYEAVRLFVERARLRSPHFELRAENATAVAQICRGLEGMPLAIELAAARVRVLSVEQILERLEDSLKLLRGDSRSAAPRQQTLRATLDWSHNLLSAEERVLLRRLSAFAGGWTLEATEAIGRRDGIREEDVLDLLSNLADKSLVVTEARAAAVMRYRMLEPVRQYARVKLEASGEADTVRQRHASFFLALAKEAEPGLTGVHQQAWAERLEAEHDNLREALSWSLANEPESALRLAEALARFWEMRSQFLEGSGWLEAALGKTGHTDPATRAKALTEAGTFAFHRGDYERATTLHGEALTLYRELGDERGVAWALLCLGAQEVEQGHHQRAKPLFETALTFSRRLGDKRTVGYALHNLGEVAHHSGEYERAKTLGMEGLSVFREMDDKWCVARTLGWLGRVTVYESEDLEAAAGFLREGLALNRDVGNWEWVAYSLENFAALAGAKAQGARAARLWGAAQALREEIGSPLQPSDRPDYDHNVAAARARLDEASWGAAFAEGKSMELEEAVEYALSEEETTPASSQTPEDQPLAHEQPPALTHREQEVAALVVRGLTNRRIAEELFLSERTVHRHVSNVLKKLGIASREQVAARLADRQPLNTD